MFDNAKTYIGTKLLAAVPLSRGEYCKFREWDVPADENPEDTGYIVQYADGYVSWTPTAQFEEAYYEVPVEVDAATLLTNVRHKTELLIG